MKIGIFCGSKGASTTEAAAQIQTELKALGFNEVERHDIAKDDLSVAAKYDCIVLGSSTWGKGKLPDDWVGKEDLSALALNGKKVAIFGTGDQKRYPDAFVDAVGILAEAAKKAGATLIGSWPCEGYEFNNSLAKEGDKFLGLALDNDNQSDLTADRIKSWVGQLKAELS